MNRNLQHLSPVSNHTAGKERQSMETGPYSFVQEPSAPASQHHTFKQIADMDLLGMNVLKTCSVKETKYSINYRTV